MNTNNQDVVDFLHANAHWSDFYRSLSDQLNQRGSLTDRQLAAARNGMAKQAATVAAKAANSGAVELSAIDKLFSTAKSNGLKKPIWRAAGLEIHTDRQYGCNDLWIKNEAGYAGKIINGHFQAFRKATEETLPTLRAIAADPLQAALDYGNATNRCSCCGKKLKAGVSVVSGIGPICAENWGLEGFREAAAALIAKEKMQ